jgi:hypothetical protein
LPSAVENIFLQRIPGHSRSALALGKQLVKGIGHLFVPALDESGQRTEEAAFSGGGVFVDGFLMCHIRFPRVTGHAKAFYIVNGQDIIVCQRSI